LRIAFVAPLDAPLCDVTSRGASAVVADLSRAMLARGHEVMVFCAQGSYLADVPTAPITVDAHAFEQLFFHLEQWSPEVISQNAFAAEPFTLAGDVPTVHTLHANPVDGAAADAVRATDAAVVAVSHDSARRWSAAGARHVHAIPNGVRDIPVTVGAPDAIGLIAGRIGPEKGTAVALRAARAAGLQAVLVGDVCDQGYFAREVAPLLAGVRYSRTLSRERVRALMARAAVTLAPIGSDEAFGMVAAEAQLAGCPVVGYARGALPELVPEGIGGALVRPDDEEALVHAIPVIRTLDREAIRAAALERFDLTRMVDAHEALLLEAAGLWRTEAAA